MNKKKPFTIRLSPFTRWIREKPEQMLWLTDTMYAHMGLGYHFRFTWYWEMMIVRFGYEPPDSFIELAKAHIKQYYPRLKKTNTRIGAKKHTPPKQGGRMKIIPLGDGEDSVLVDDDVFEWAKDLPLVKVSRGYAGMVKQSRQNGKRLTHTTYLHREIIKARPKEKVDHINHNKLDCRMENLRIATVSQNSMNQILQKREKSSRFKGVCREKVGGKCRAYIRHNHVWISLGYFHDEEEAAKAYDKKAIELFGEFAMTNKMMGLY